MLHILRESGGTAISVSDEELLNGMRTIGKYTGIFSAPEGGAALAAAQKLRDSNQIKLSDSVVIFITGSGLKYTDTLGDYLYNQNNNQ